MKMVRLFTVKRAEGSANDHSVCVLPAPVFVFVLLGVLHMFLQSSWKQETQQ